MNLAELEQQVSADCEPCEPDADDDMAEDLYEALELCRDSLDYFETLLAQNKSKKFMLKNQRKDVLHHAAELMTFLDQWESPTEEGNK